MSVLAAFVRFVDWLNEIVGRATAWLTLAMVLITFFVVVARYGFAWGRVWIQESYVWHHGIVFMVAAGYTLKHNAHVRVDVFYRPAGAHYKAWVDLLGSLLLLLPFVVLIAWFSYPYVADSWARSEGSFQAGGLPAVYLLKSVLLVFCLLLGLQGLSLAARSVLVLARYPGFEPVEEEQGGV